MAKNQTNKAADKASAGIDPKVQAIFTAALGILGSKVSISEEHINRQVEFSIIGNGVALERGAWLYNTNVTTPERLNKALDMLNPEEFFANVTSEEDATKLTREALNAASVSFSIPFGRGEKLSQGELIVGTVQQYFSNSTNQNELGLRFVRKAQAIALSSSNSNSRLAEYRSMATADPMED